MSGNRQKVLIFLAAIVAFLLVISPPVLTFAQTSLSGLQACAKDASCATTLGLQAAPKAQRFLGGANTIKPFTRVPAGGGAPSSIPAAAPAAGGDPWGVIIPGGLLGAGAIVPFTEPMADKLRDKAKENYCLQNPAACETSGPQSGYFAYKMKSHYSTDGSTSYREGTGYAPFSIQVRPTNFGFSNRLLVFFNASGQELTDHFGIDEPALESSYTLTPLTTEAEEELERAGPDYPDNLGDYLNPGDYADALAGGEPIPLSPGDTVSGGELSKLNSDGSLSNLGDPHVAPDTSGDPDSGKDTDRDGFPDSDDTDLDGDGLPNSSDPDIDGDGLPNSEDPDFQGNKAPPGSTNPSGELPKTAEPAQFTKPNFLAYGWEVFSNKFPLDIIGTPPQDPGVSVCPNLTFWGRSFELCIVLHFIQALQVPVIISFLIWAVLAL